MCRELHFGLVVAFVPLLSAVMACDDDRAPSVDPGGEPGPPGTGGVAGGAGGGGAIDEIDLTLCELSPLTIVEDPDGVDPEFDVAGGTDDFVVAFADTRNAVEDVFARRIDANGVLGPEQRVTDDAALAREPAVIATDAGFLVAFSDDAAGTSFDVRARPLGPTGVPEGPAELVSTDPLADEIGPSLVASGAPGESLLAFSSIDQGVTQRRIAPIDDEALLAGPPQTVSDAFEVDSTLDLASLGIGPSGIASFIDVRGDLQLLRLAEDGSASGIPTVLRSGDDFTQTFDVTAGPTGGLAVFGFDRGVDDPAVAVRAFDTAGEPADVEIPLFEEASVRGRNPTAVPIGNGFAVAFRRSDSLGTTIRLVLLDANGDVVAQRDIGSASAADGSLRLARSGDDTLLAVFDEPLETGGFALEGVRVECPID